MLYVFVGNDGVVVRKDAHVFLDTLEGEVVRITAESYSPGMLIDHVYAQSLFGESPGPVVLDFLSEADGALESFEEDIDLYAQSERVFVLLDTKPRAAYEKKLRIHAEKYTESEERDEKEGFNTFLLADAFLRRDKKSLWVLLMRAYASGVSPEEVAGVLFWQIKSLLLVAVAQSAEQAGMKEYPYKKAKSALKLFTTESLVEISSSLLTVYHRGHSEGDMSIDLERFLLRV